MEPQNTTKQNQGAGGAQPNAQGANVRDIADTYERARREMNDAVARLRQEMERIDVARARQQAQDWVNGNPTLATFLAVGGGIALGRLLSIALKTPPPPPPSFPEQVRDRVFDYAGVARDYAGDIGKAIATSAAIASAALASRVSDAGEVVSRRAADLGESLADRASHVSHDVSKRARRAAHVVQDEAEDLSDTLKKKVGGVSIGEGLMGAATTVVAAVLVKKITDMMSDGQ